MSYLQKEIIDFARRMPPPSHSAMRLMELVSDPDYKIEEVTQVVETDPSLTAQVLKIVNSAAFGLGQSIDTVRRAVGFLGNRLVIGIAVGSCAQQVFDKPLEGYESRRGELWQHSLKTAIASRQIALLAKDEINPDVAFTAGLLHDIGKSVLTEFLMGRSRSMVEKMDDGLFEDYIDAEDEAVGTNHCQIGAELAKMWSLPEDYRLAILHHHFPSKAAREHQPLIYMVHLGDIVAMMGGSSTGADALGYKLDGGYASFVQIDKVGIERLMMKVLIEFEQTKAALFGL